MRRIYIYITYNRHLKKNKTLYVSLKSFTFFIECQKGITSLELLIFVCLRAYVIYLHVCIILEGFSQGQNWGHCTLLTINIVANII